MFPIWERSLTGEVAQLSSDLEKLWDAEWETNGHLYVPVLIDCPFSIGGIQQRWQFGIEGMALQAKIGADHIIDDWDEAEVRVVVSRWLVCGRWQWFPLQTGFARAFSICQFKTTSNRHLPLKG